MPAPASRCLRVLLLASSGWLAACSGAHEPPQTTTTAAHAGTAPTANVPALVGMSIDELHGRLGLPQPLPTFAAAALLEAVGPASRSSARDSLASFQTGGLTLIASYDARTRRVRDLLLLGHHEDSLMARAALQANASKYLVLPVFGNSRPNYLLGLRVIATE